MKNLVFCSGVLVLAAAAVVIAAGGPPLPGAPVRAGEAGDAGGGCVLTVRIDGLPSASFRGVEGLDVSTEVVEFRDSAVPNLLRKLPGRTTYGDLLLRFDPVPTGDEVWKWYSDVLAGKVEKKKMSIVLSRDGKELRRYDFTGAWPCKWGGPRQGGADPEARAEEVTITYESMLRTTTTS